MIDNFHNKIADAWIQHDVDSILLIVKELKAQGALIESDILIAFAKSISGKLLDAHEDYSKIKAPSKDNLIQSLFEIDSAYCETKLQRKSAKTLVSKRLSLLIKLIFSGKSDLARMLVHHGLYSWYITAFWYNHIESLFSSLLLICFGFFTQRKESKIHGLFLLGHLANVKGYPKIGVPLVTASFDDYKEIRPWIKSPFLSYMAYGLYMVGQAQDTIPKILKEAKVALQKYPDPFYQILLYVSILRSSSQVGDIETSEEVATKLIKFSEATKTHRFYYSSKADLALCYGIRGLYWRCDEILKDLENYEEIDADPVEAGSFFRLRGWAYFFVGKYEKALSDAQKALFYFSKSKSFFMAKAMSETLRVISLFRLNLDKCHSVDESINITKKHASKIKQLKMEYSQNPVLVKMLTEEESSLVASFGRFWQPGYSRDANVISCQQRLHSVLNDVALASTDDLAWSVVLKEISTPLALQLDSRERLNYKPEFEIRNTHGERPGIELVIDRSSSNLQNFDLIKFSIINGSNLLSVLDALYTLLPTLNCLFKIRDQQSFILSAERDKTFNLVASQVAHDIRSPLSALNMISSALSDVPEEKRLLIRNASKRINDIANQLISKVKESHSKQNTETKSPSKIELLSAIIDVLVSEKRIQYRDNLNIEIDADLQSSYGLFASVDSTEVKRVLSNLINNSVEAFKNNEGLIIVGIEPESDFVRVFIKDNGSGIPKHILEKLGQRGVTHGKGGTDSGSGLGVYHAKKTIEELGGQFLIESEENIGTKISLLFKKAPTPSWFVDKLTVTNSTKIVCVDDDVSIHNIWDKKFESIGKLAKNNIIHFSSGDNLEKWINLNLHESENAIYLMDYELLGQSRTGMDLIEQLAIAKKAILVTSRFEENEIQQRCARLGVKLIPKGLASLVPIEFQKAMVTYDACLIDDDSLVNRPKITHNSTPSITTEVKTRYDLCLLDDDKSLVHSIWEIVAKTKGHNIKMFSTPEEFQSAADSIDRETPIFVDVSLGNGVSGVDFSEVVHKMGFLNINLATGYSADSIKAPSFIGRIIGKDYPEII